MSFLIRDEIREIYTIDIKSIVTTFIYIVRKKCILLWSRTCPRCRTGSGVSIFHHLHLKRMSGLIEISRWCGVRYLGTPTVSFTQVLPVHKWIGVFLLNEFGFGNIFLVKFVVNITLWSSTLLILSSSGIFFVFCKLSLVWTLRGYRSWCSRACGRSRFRPSWCWPRRFHGNLFIKPKFQVYRKGLLPVYPTSDTVEERKPFPSTVQGSGLFFLRSPTCCLSLRMDE